MAETKVDHQGPEALSAAAVRGWMAVVGLVSMAAVVPARPRDYMMSFWALSYQRGYRARGLPGAVLQWLGVERISVQLVTVVSVALLLAGLALLVELGARAYRNDPGWPTFLLGMLLVGSPATLQFLALELGAFDHFLTVLTVGPLLLLLDDRGRGRLITVGLLTTVAVLIHEGFVLLGLPLIVAAVVVRRGAPVRRRLVAEVAVVVAGPVLALAWIQAGPTLSPDDLPARHAEVLEVAEVAADHRPVVWPIANHTRSFTENIAYTADRIRERGHREHLVALLACLPTLAAVVAVGRQRLGGRDRRLLVVLWAGVVAAPLLLAPIGHDWGRWMVYATFNGLLAVVWLDAHRRPPTEATTSHTPMALMAIALILPALTRSGAFRADLGHPIEVVRTLFGL